MQFIPLDVNRNVFFIDVHCFELHVLDVVSSKEVDFHVWDLELAEHLVHVVNHDVFALDDALFVDAHGNACSVTGTCQTSH
jgi:hypothetical protein